jgi:phosphatidylethanolamine-binding protein (PEBP) family uncharacterized protein
LTAADAQAPPSLFFNSQLPAGTGTGTYLVISLDIDAPFPSFNILSPILHWIQPDLKSSGLESPTTNNNKTLSSASPFIANYIGPAPPPGSAPHRYVFLLYEQPEKYVSPGGKGKNVGMWPRVRYDLDAFEKEAGLGAVIAANYFCSN